MEPDPIMPDELPPLSRVNAELERRGLPPVVDHGRYYRLDDPNRPAPTADCPHVWGDVLAEPADVPHIVHG